MEWKAIQRLNGRFEVSSSGLLRNAETGKVLKLNLINKYLGAVVKPDGRSGKSYAIKVHREVALNFVANPDGKKYVNHIDGNKLNNDAANLEWVTSSENTLHAYQIGLKLPMEGEESPADKLTEKLNEKIRNEYIPHDREFGLRALGRKYGFTHNTMSEALNGVCWKSLKSTVK